MRFSIVFDDNGTILAASVGDEEANNAARGPGVSSGCFDISDDLPDAELHQTVERLLIRKLTREELKQRGSQGRLILANLESTLNFLTSNNPPETERRIETCRD